MFPKQYPRRAADHRHRPVVRPRQRDRCARAVRCGSRVPHLGGPASPRPSLACACVGWTVSTCSTPTKRRARASADINLIIAGTRDAITMVEGGAAEAGEDAMLDCFDLAQDAIRKIIDTHRRSEEGRRQAQGRSARRSPSSTTRSSSTSTATGRSRSIKALAIGGQARAVKAALKTARNAMIEKIVAKETEDDVIAAKTADAKKAWEKLHPHGHAGAGDQRAHPHRRPRARRDPRHLVRGERGAPGPRLGDTSPAVRPRPT